MSSSWFLLHGTAFLRTLKDLVAPFINILMFYIKYFKYTQCKCMLLQYELLYGLCVCTEDRPFAKAPGLSSSTDAHTI